MHQPITLKLALGGTSYRRKFYRKTTSAAELYEAKVKDMVADNAKKTEDDRK